MADAQQAIVLRNKVRAGDLVAVRKMLQAGVDFTLPGTTLREWTPLHTAAWGTAKPQNDRDIVEALLTAAAKSGKGKEEALRSAKDAKDGSAQHAEDAPLVKRRSPSPLGLLCALARLARVALGTLEEQPCRSEGESAARTPASADVADAEAFKPPGSTPLDLVKERREALGGGGSGVGEEGEEGKLKPAAGSTRRPRPHACPSVAPLSSVPLFLGRPSPAERLRRLPGLCNDPLHFSFRLPRRRLDRIIEWLEKGVNAG
jgi:hypothetical protein